MDRTDRKILALLQEDGRLTVTELAQRVGLTVAPCHRRLRELERSGVIRGYRAVVDPGALGRGFEDALITAAAGCQGWASRMNWRTSRWPVVKPASQDAR